MTRKRAPMTRAEKAVIDAAEGKPWGKLADWLDIKFPDDKDPEIQRDLRKLDAACARLAKERARGRP